MTTLEQEIIIQRDTGIRSATETIAVQLEDIADQIEAKGHHEEAETLREDAQTIRDPDETEWMMWADDVIIVAEMALEELTGLHAVSIPENSAWLIVTPAGLEQLSEEN